MHELSDWSNTDYSQEIVKGFLMFEAAQYAVLEQNWRYWMQFSQLKHQTANITYIWQRTSSSSSCVPLDGWAVAPDRRPCCFSPAPEQPVLSSESWCYNKKIKKYKSITILTTQVMNSTLVTYRDVWSLLNKPCESLINGRQDITRL